MLMEFPNSLNGGFSDGVIIARGTKGKSRTAAVATGYPEQRPAIPALHPCE